MNSQTPKDFFIDQEGVGRFRFNRRTYGANIKIAAVAARILGPGGWESEADPVMQMHASLVSFYSSLVSDCPPGWEDIEAIDLTERPELEEDIFQLWVKLKKRLDSFRHPQGTAGENPAGQGAGDGVAQDNGILGAQQVPAGTHGSEVAGA